MSAKVSDSTMIAVCAACSQASCWQAVFMCDRSQNANVKQVSVGELRALGLENECYWDIDPDTGVSRTGGLR